MNHFVSIFVSLLTTKINDTPYNKYRRKTINFSPSIIAKRDTIFFSLSISLFNVFKRKIRLKKYKKINVKISTFYFRLTIILLRTKKNHSFQMQNTPPKMHLYYVWFSTIRASPRQAFGLRHLPSRGPFTPFVRTIR